MKPVSRAINMADKNNRPLRPKAAWRDLTDEQVKNLPSTRDEAYATDSLYYYNGSPCIRGHISPRYRTGRTCLMCKHEDNLKAAKNTKPSTKNKIKSILPTVVMGIKMSMSLSDNKE